MHDFYTYPAKFTVRGASGKKENLQIKKEIGNKNSVLWRTKRGGY